MIVIAFLRLSWCRSSFWFPMKPNFLQWLQEFLCFNIFKPVWDNFSFYVLLIVSKRHAFCSAVVFFFAPNMLFKISIEAFVFFFDGLLCCFLLANTTQNSAKFLKSLFFFRLSDLRLSHNVADLILL